MEYFYSNTKERRLLHFIHRFDEFGDRKELIDPSEVLQLSSQVISRGVTFRAHRHIPKSVDIREIVAQEAWVVLSGSVRVTYFDEDGLEICKRDLGPGDVSVTLFGGHSYQILEESKVLEFKTGPYMGQMQDKVFIDDGGPVS